jgi:hypothetical protein
MVHEPYRGPRWLRVPRGTGRHIRLRLAKAESHATALTAIARGHDATTRSHDGAIDLAMRGHQALKRRPDHGLSRRTMRAAGITAQLVGQFWLPRYSIEAHSGSGFP